MTTTELRAATRAALVVACAALATGCGGQPQTKAAAPAAPRAVHLAPVRRGEVTRSITLPASVRAYQEATLYAKVAGYLKTIDVDKGDHVKEGALLAEIEVPELIAERAKDRAQVEVANIDYKRLSESQKKAPDLVVPQ